MSSSKEESKTKESLKKVGWFALKTAGISAAVIGGVAIAVPVIGFTAVGVAAGSLAAAYQSTVLGAIASGSGFAVLQIIGGAGLAAGTKAVSAAVSGAHTAWKAQRGKNDGKSNPPPDNSSHPMQVSNDEKPDVSPDDSPFPIQVSNDKKSDKSEDLNEEEAEQEDTDENRDKVMEKTLKKNKSVRSYSNTEVNDNLINEKKFLEENTTFKKTPSRNLSSLSHSKMITNSLESKWNDVELTDDVSISKSIAKRLK